jgi:putrescine---pyruvate transaminase
MTIGVPPQIQAGRTSSALWHPFADMGAVEQAPFVLASGEGSWIVDTDGRRYLDATASLWYSNLGHGREEVVEAVVAQMRRLDAYMIFGDYANEPAMELADRLAALAPAAGAKVFLGSGGGDMIDTAAKLARAHFQQRRQPERLHIITRRHGYHGTHGFGTSLGGIEANTSGYGPLVPNVSVVDHASPEALEAEIQRVGANRVAAFFCEPVIGAGGVHLPPPGYIEAVARICEHYGVLFVADCVICGFGRLGTWLGIDRWPVEPDMVVLAKGVTAGILPVGALIVAEEVAAPFFPGAPGAPVLRHGATYAGHPTCCAAANATLDVYERDELIPRGRELETDLERVLQPLADHPLVAEVRAGLGLLAGVDLAPQVLAADATAVRRWQLACRSAGLLVRPLGRGIAISPPLTITGEELELIGERLLEGLQALERDLAAAGAQLA